VAEIISTYESGLCLPAAERRLNLAVGFNPGDGRRMFPRRASDG